MSELSTEVTEQNESAGTAMITSRQSQEVQAAMIVAKRFPRDETKSISRIVESCKRVKLAESAIYSYAKGGTAIEGPSIRLAEVIAQQWGNIDFGIVELSQENGKSEVMAYAWDLETNTRQSKTFSVPHRRYTRKGSYSLDDPREIYETIANNGARRMRACILSVIPGDVTELALERCNETLKSQNKDKPLVDRIRQMVIYFKDKHQVSQEMLEARLQHKIEATSENEMVSLRKILTSLNDGMSTRDQWFTVEQTSKPASDITSEIEKGTKPETKEETKPEKPAKKTTKKSAKSKKPENTENDFDEVFKDCKSPEDVEEREAIAADGLDEKDTKALNDAATRKINQLEAELDKQQQTLLDGQGDPNEA